MHLSETIQLIRPAIHRVDGTWADFGAGSGAFTLALASILEPSARILAIDRDAGALLHVAGSLHALRSGHPPVETIQGDFLDLAGIEALEAVRLSGALFANALHFVPDAGEVLRQLRGRLDRGGRVVVVEYEDRPRSRWVPYPISPPALQDLARGAGLRFLGVVGRRPSRYGGSMYCAALENAEMAPRT